MGIREWSEREKIYACWLCNFPGISSRKLCRLAELCGSMEEVYHASKDVWEKVLSPDQAESLKAYTASWKPEEEYRRMQKEGIGLVTIGEQGFPGRLKEIPDPPFCLFFRGRLPGEDVPAAAVIGARECSEYGGYVADRLGRAFGRSGIALVSGMARGIDGISQRAALSAGGYSVGVLGSGVDVCYPAQNKDLYRQLAESGAVISSYPLGSPALARNFPPRNRIVSGLADIVIVIEARAKSGTLITVDMALEQGREVYVVPGRVTDRLSDGCNRLIKQGAGVLADLDEFMEEIWQLWKQKGIRKKDKDLRAGKPECDVGRLKNGKKREECPERLAGKLAAVYGVLDFTPKSAAEIQTELSDNYGTQDVAAFLMKLVVEQLAVQVSPGRFCRRGRV